MKVFYYFEAPELSWQGERLGVRDFAFSSDLKPLKKLISRTPEELVILFAACDDYKKLLDVLSGVDILVPLRFSASLLFPEVENQVFLAPWVDSRRCLGIIELRKGLFGLSIKKKRLKLLRHLSNDFLHNR